jgi:hypothetical protein
MFVGKSPNRNTFNKLLGPISSQRNFLRYSEKDFFDYLRYLKQDDVFDKNFIHRIKKKAKIENVYEDLVSVSKQESLMTDRNTKSQKLVANI